MSIEERLQRQININLQLRRQLENCRRDVVEYCAKFCAEHEVMLVPGKGYKLELMPQDGRTYTHSGDIYAVGLRDLIGK